MKEEKSAKKKKKKSSLGKITSFQTGGAQREDSFQAREQKAGGGEGSLLPGTAGFPLRSSAGTPGAAFSRITPRAARGGEAAVFPPQLLFPFGDHPKATNPTPFPPRGALPTPVCVPPGAGGCSALPVPGAIGSRGGRCSACSPARPGGVLHGVCCPPGDTEGSAAPYRHRTGTGCPPPGSPGCAGVLPGGAVGEGTEKETWGERRRGGKMGGEGGRNGTGDQRKRRRVGEQAKKKVGEV